MSNNIEINNKYILTRATTEMAEAITEEVNQAYGKQFSQYIVDTFDHPSARINVDKVRSMILDPNMTLYVLVNKTNHAVAGTICYVPTAKKEQGYFGLFSLEKEAQGKGIGPQMISFIEQQAKNDGKKRMKIDVSGFAENLHSYYERLGYQKTGKTIKFEKGIHWKLKEEYAHSEKTDFFILKKNLTKDN